MTNIDPRPERGKHFATTTARAGTSITHTSTSGPTGDVRVNTPLTPARESS